MIDLEMPYTPRPLWENVIHPALDAHRFAVLVCHRRFGKTVGVICQMLKRAWECKKESPRYAYVAPYRNQAKMIAWEYIKFYSSVIPKRKVNESELYIELPSIHANRSGARIYIIGADHPDALRGGYFDGAILDEYAQIKKELWDEVLRPALSDREGWAVFIGTPKGQNQFYETYQRALNDPAWFSCLYSVADTGIIPPDELEDMQRDMTPMAIRQELYCDFSASASDVVIPIDLVTAASKRELTEADVAGAPVILGLDVARFGDDATVLTVRKGLWCQRQQVHRGLDTMQAADVLINAINTYNPKAVFVDVGAMGAGVVDRVRQLHYRITEVNFGGSPQDTDRYANLRAEMYFKLRKWLEDGGALPNEPTLKSELSVVEYQFARNGKIILEPKEKVKEKIGKSPDYADSLALTFAMPVFAGVSKYEPEEEEYDALARY